MTSRLARFGPRSDSTHRQIDRRSHTRHEQPEVASWAANYRRPGREPMQPIAPLTEENSPSLLMRFFTGGYRYFEWEGDSVPDIYWRP
jgi:hypothetical protein